jgi:hypothetical protein
MGRTAVAVLDTLAQGASCMQEVFDHLANVTDATGPVSGPARIHSFSF